MFKNNTLKIHQYFAAIFLVVAIPCCAEPAKTVNYSTLNNRLMHAEKMVEAFYSFKPEPLAQILINAGESKKNILFYQGWAEGGNYIVMENYGCKVVEKNKIDCAITVQDDLVLALGIDFNVTDVFHLEFNAEQIISVKTSSNDPQLYHDASKWVKDQYPEKIKLSCKGTDEYPASAKQCVQNMLSGYVEYAQLNKLTARAASGI